MTSTLLFLKSAFEIVVHNCIQDNQVCCGEQLRSRLIYNMYSKNTELTPLPSKRGYYHPYQSLDDTSKKSFDNDDNHGIDELGEEDVVVVGTKPVLCLSKEWSIVLGIAVLFLSLLSIYIASDRSTSFLQAAWSSRAAPFSTVDPASLGFIPMDRPDISKPGPIFGDLLDRNLPLPTNSWYENFLLGMRNDGQENKVFQVPYILDTGGHIPGVRTHSCHVQANNRAVMASFIFFNAYVKYLKFLIFNFTIHSIR